MVPVKFSRKTLPQKEGLGEKLAKKRVALGYSVRDVEKAIRIRADYIDDIEAGKYDRLPPKVFVRGFIKSYAKLLNLNPEKVLQLYERERGMVESVKNAVVVSPVVKPIKAPRIILTPKTMLIFGASLVALVIVFYIGWQVRILTAPPKLTINSPIDNVPIKADSVAVEGKTEAGATLFINDVEVGVDQNGLFKEKVSLQNGVNRIIVKAQNKLGKYTQETRLIVAEVQSNTAVAGAVASGVELKITIGPKPASIQVEIDGKKVTEKPIIMLAGVTQTYKASEKIILVTNNGGSVSVVVNGQSVGPIGKDGEAVNREFVKGMEIK